MDFRRILVSALARRIACVVVAAFLAWCGIGSARAQDYSDCFNQEIPGDASTYCPTIADAHRMVTAAAKYHGTEWAKPGSCNGNGACYAEYRGPFGNRLAERHYRSGCDDGKVFNGSTGECQKPCTSAARPSVTVPRSPLSGSVGCNTGCAVTYRNNGDDTSTVSVTGAMCGPDFKNNCPTGTFWNGMMGLCQPIDPTCPAGQVKKEGVCEPDNKCPQGMVAVQGTTPGAVQQGELFCKAETSECPAGTIKAPATGKCIPGEGQCAAGEARRDNGTCGKDSDGDGKADEDDDNPDNDPKKDSASGGDSCDSPPSCSGNAIACIQVKIQWRIDCNTRRAANISGGTCDAVPICTGKKCDAMEYAQLMQQWRATCALEKLAKKGTGETGTDGTDANKNGVADALEGAVGSAGAGDTPTVTKFGAGFSTSVIDRENIFGGGSCPQPPTFKLMGSTISGSDFPYWCQAMAILRALILIFGAYTALKILMGWGH